MGSIDDIMQLCRLCLVKDQVNIPIFDETSDIRQTFLKISQCLPVKVSRDDNLPKKICDGCSYKLDMLYVFRNTSVDSEKQLMTWLSQAGLGSCSLPQTMIKDGVTKPEIMVKQETFETTDVRLEGDNPDLNVDANEELGVDAHSYIMQQQKLPYQQDFAAFGEPSGSTNLGSEEPPPKKTKRAAATKKHVPLETEVEEALDNAMQITKAEEEDSDDVDQPDYVEAPSTSADDQPGPSGVGKGTIEAPWEDNIKIEEHKPYGTSSSHLEQNTNSDSRNKGHMCSRCQIKFLTKNLLVKHKREVHWEKIFACLECDSRFKTRGELRSHAEKHSTEMSYYCEVCDQRVRTYAQLIDHRSRHRKKRFPCTECDKTFATESSRNKHYNNHHNKTHVCHVCKRVFKLQSSLKRHMTLHEDTQTVVTCDLCEKSYSGPFARSSLIKHVSVVHQGKRYLCTVCGKIVTSNGSLKSHMKIHSGDKPHVCDYCKKSFSDKQVLKVHIRMHTKEKPFSCKLCDKKYTQQISLTLHMRSAHTGEKPYGCHICSSRFISKTLLNSHLKRHFNEK